LAATFNSRLDWQMLRVLTCFASATALSALVLGAVLLVGCGGGGTSPVTGKVVYADGQPVAGGTVIFTSAATKTTATGEIKPDGTFQLTTESTGDGAAPGEYSVVVHDAREYGKDSMIAPKYRDIAQTPLKFTVEPKSNEFEIKVERVTR
jgi:hypothetical protein